MALKKWDRAKIYLDRAARDYPGKPQCD